MKISVIFFALCLLCGSEGMWLADNFKQGLQEEGILQIEPDLSGVELHESLINILTTYVKSMEDAFYKQFGYYMEHYAGGAEMRAENLRRACEAPDPLYPPDAFDDILTNHTVFLVDFKYMTQEYLSEKKLLVATQMKTKKSSLQLTIQPKTTIHGLNDFLSHFDLMWSSNLASLSNYIDEMIFLGKNRVIQDYQQVVAQFRDSLRTQVCKSIKDYMGTVEFLTYKLQGHSTPIIWYEFQKAISDATAVIEKIQTI